MVSRFVAAGATRLSICAAVVIAITVIALPRAAAKGGSGATGRPSDVGRAVRRAKKTGEDSNAIIGREKGEELKRP